MKLLLILTIFTQSLFAATYKKLVKERDLSADEKRLVCEYFSPSEKVDSNCEHPEVKEFLKFIGKILIVETLQQRNQPFSTFAIYDSDTEELIISKNATDVMGGFSLTVPNMKRTFIHEVTHAYQKFRYKKKFIDKYGEAEGEKKAEAAWDKEKMRAISLRKSSGFTGFYNECNWAPGSKGFHALNLEQQAHEIEELMHKAEARRRRSEKTKNKKNKDRYYAEYIKGMELVKKALEDIVAN